MAISFVVDRVESQRWSWWLVIDDRKRINGSVYNTQAKALAEAERFREQVAHAEVVVWAGGTTIEVPRRQAPPFKTTTGHKGAAKAAPARKAAAKKTPARKAAVKKSAAKRAR